MRKDQLTEILNKQKNDPGIQALKNFLATKEIKSRKPESNISFAEFVDYLDKNNQMKLLISILDQISILDKKNLSESKEKSAVFFRDFREADKKAKIEELSKFPILEKLPEEIAAEVASNLSDRDILNASLASKTTHKMFKEPRDVAKLLHFVNEADYDAVEKMVKENPLLMFQYVSYQKADGSYETISPLKLAIKLCDTYMWKMFQDQIKDNPKLLERFMKQAHAQKERINLEPLFAEYKTYGEKYNLWVQKKISDKDIDKAWLNVGKKQREILPRHMLKEFCRKGNSWSAESKFDADVDPRPVGADIYNYTTRRDESVLPWHRNSGLGFAFSLVRGAGGERVGGARMLPGRSHVYAEVAAIDSAVFDHLCKVRTEDLNRILQLAPGPTDAKKKGL